MLGGSCSLLFNWVEMEGGGASFFLTTICDGVLRSANSGCVGLSPKGTAGAEERVKSILMRLKKLREGGRFGGFFCVISLVFHYSAPFPFHCCIQKSRSESFKGTLILLSHTYFNLNLHRETTIAFFFFIIWFYIYRCQLRDRNLFYIT